MWEEVLRGKSQARIIGTFSLINLYPHIRYMLDFSLAKAHALVDFMTIVHKSGGGTQNAAARKLVLYDVKIEQLFVNALSETPCNMRLLLSYWTYIEHHGSFYMLTS